jgi:hypothetical protein
VKEQKRPQESRGTDSRSHFDLVVLNPVFITEYNLKNVVNKNIRNLELRKRTSEEYRKELIATIELNYVYDDRASFLDDVQQDINKLLDGMKEQDYIAYHLVFCNHNYYFKDELRKIVQGTTSAVKAILVISYRVGQRKVSPNLFTNGWDL